jgi:hypothetical protein
MFLGIDDNSHLVYEGYSPAVGHPVDPSPIITQAWLSYVGDDPCIGLSESAHARGYRQVFREDMFDPVTRLRRGRLYQISESVPEKWRVSPHPKSGTGHRVASAGFHRDGLVEKDLIGFDPLFVSDNFGAFRSRPVVVALGTKGFSTLWRLIEIERISTGDELVTLRATSSLGALPMLHRQALPAADSVRISGIFELLASDVHRSTSASIVDHCRDLASAVLFARLRVLDPECRALDLGDLIKKFESTEELKAYGTLISSAQIINRLHPRRKPSEQERRQIRPLHPQDAEYAVLAASTILCELGWAYWV